MSALALAACGGGSGTKDAAGDAQAPADGKDATVDMTAPTDTASHQDALPTDTAMDVASTPDLGGGGTDAKPDVTGTDGGADTAPDTGTNTTPDSGTVDAAKDAVVAVDAGTDAGTDATPTVAMCGRIKCDCTLKGIPLYGRYRIVTFNEDFKIRETSFPDLKVLKTNFADSCGEWQEVTFNEDFTVRVVTFNEDFQIAYSNFPGVAKAPGN
jgi:hypothetical protein